MSKNKQRLWLFFLILLYIGIAVVGFGIAYFVKVTFFAPAQSLSQTAKQTTSVTIAPGWKTYTNTGYKLQFSYPPTDTLATKSYGFGVTSVTLQAANGNADFQILLLPKALATAAGQDFDSYYALPDNTSKIIKNPLAQDTTTEKFTKIRNRTVSGNQALDYQSIASNAQPNTQPEIGTFVEIGNNVILFSTGEGNKEKLEEILNSLH